MRLSIGITVVTLFLGCVVPDTKPPAETVVIAALDTVLTTESASLAAPVDLDVDPDGRLYVSDAQANQLLLVDLDRRDTTRIGGPGQGPGELSAPGPIAALPGGVLVVDRRNSRVQHFTSAGEVVEVRPASPWVLSGPSFLRQDGHLFATTRGQRGRLAIEFDSRSTELRSIGVPVVDPPEIANFAAIKAAIADRTIPDDIRNEALIAADAAGQVWVAMQTEGEIHRYDASGTLLWRTVIEEPQMMHTLESFFKANAAEPNPARFISLRYFRDVEVVGDDLWVLLDSSPPDPAVVMVIGRDGTYVRRIEIALAGGATSLAVDQVRRRLFLASRHDAQLLLATIP